MDLHSGDACCICIWVSVKAIGSVGFLGWGGSFCVQVSSYLGVFVWLVGELIVGFAYLYSCKNVVCSSMNVCGF